MCLKKNAWYGFWQMDLIRIKYMEIPQSLWENFIGKQTQPGLKGTDTTWCIEMTF